MANKKSRTEKFRSRSLGMVLWCEDETHRKAMEKIKSSYDYIAILHDKDIYTADDEKDNSEHVKGTLKKPHWHVILRFKNGVWNTSICQDLGITINYTEQLRNFDNAMMYLIHYNDDDKTLYDLDEVFGPLKDRLIHIINSQNKDEGEKIVELIEFIEQQEKYLTVTEFAKYCARNGYWAEFRRSGAIFCRMIEERNEKTAFIRNNKQST